MKVLFYTRIEGNTGGDEARLFMVATSLIKNLPEKAQVNLYLAYDEVSKNRAHGIKEKWNTMMAEKSFGAKVWLQQVRSETAALSQCISTNPPQGTELRTFIGSNKSSKKVALLDLFVIAGWSHQLNVKSAEHVYRQLRVPPTTKILLCATPEKSIDTNDFKTALLARNYTEIYCLQIGVYEPGGLPIPQSITIESMEANESREAWLTHVRTKRQYLQSNASDGYLTDDALKLYCSSEGERQGDKLIVIYCSKDGPEESVCEFFDDITEEINEDINNYAVILIGIESQSEMCEKWHFALKVYDIDFERIYKVPRTDSSVTLMRGLRDARYAMATGSFSYLEAQKLGINHCCYLCPPHQTYFGQKLAKATPEELTAAFELGVHVLEQELPNLPMADFSPHYTHRDGGTKAPREDNHYISNLSVNNNQQHMEKTRSMKEALQRIKQDDEQENGPLLLVKELELVYF